MRDQAADAGTLAHQAVDAYFHAREFEFEGDPAVCAKARTAYRAFIEWTEQTQMRVTHTEMPLVSERYKFGGTFDAVAMGNGRAIADWKSSNKCYGEFLIQVAAYGALWEENFPDQPLTGGFHLVRFDKTFGDFHHHYWGELDVAWKAFRHLRALYDIDVELKQRVG
jgi:hypothetical protein